MIGEHVGHLREARVAARVAEHVAGRRAVQETSVDEVLQQASEPAGFITRKFRRAQGLGWQGGKQRSDTLGSRLQ